MKRRKSKTKAPLVRLVGWDGGTAALAGLAASAALAAPGELDPTFGDVGRQLVREAPFYSSLWSLDVQDDDSVLFGGGGEFDYYAWYFDSFTGRLLPDGAADPGFAAVVLAESVVYDTILQPDGKLVGVGISRQSNGWRKLLVFRQTPDGALDPEFGLGGIVLLDDGSTGSVLGRSVAVDPEGRIVVAGLRSGNHLVARFLPNGTLDASFGSAGLYLGDAASDVRVAAAPSGGYRVAANISTANGEECRVIGLTDAGTPDAAFGSAGIVTPPAPGNGTPVCSSLAVQSNGGILLGGQNWSGAVAGGYVDRLLPNGANDPDFNAAGVSGQLESVNVVAAGLDGSVYVAGRAPADTDGAPVFRLRANGTLDPLFGQSGATRIDLKTRRDPGPAAINDMKLDGNGRLVVGGGGGYGYWGGGGNAFVARLLGDTGGGPGVISLQRQRGFVTEQDGKVVLSVRRTGGSTGAVSVTYSARDFPAPNADDPYYSPGARATGGDDYTVTTGELTWADGDTSERQIEVPVASTAAPEPPEFFEVVLESPGGGAGLGTHGADVEIAGSSYPAGEFTIQASLSAVPEGGNATFYVTRNFYFQGQVSVTVRVVEGGSASPGVDFGSSVSGSWVDQVLTWNDGEIGAKPVTVRTARDNADEPNESYTLELTSPTGGAALGDTTQVTGTVLDVSPGPSSGGGGGGSFGWLGVALLGLAGLARRLTRRPVA